MIDRATTSAGTDAGLMARLQDRLGAEHVLLDLDRRVFFSTDIFTQGVTADAVVSPGSAEEVAEAVRLCTQAGYAVAPRGGGFSYTEGYVPVRAKTVIMDLRRLDTILEVNAEDLYVTVGCGCTWVQLYEALKGKGLRTPYFGPLSGFRSTVGGALSQGSFFLGSTQYGTTADTVLGLTVVLADGSVVTTGSRGEDASQSPVFRNYGPDLTGLFLHDSGALGLKVAATLKLVPFPRHTRFATLAFDAAEPAQAALSQIARGALAGECYLWDPTFAKTVLSSNGLADELRYLGGMLKSAANPLAGVRDAVRTAVAGKSAFDGKTHLLHVTMDDVSEAGVEARLKLVQAIGVAKGGRPVEPAVPRAMRGRPFNDFGLVAAASPQKRNLPTHGIFPHSKLAEASREMDTYFAAQAGRMAEHQITYGVIVFAIGANAVCLEPLLYWTDAQLALHDRIANRSDLDGLARFDSRPRAGQVVSELRAGLVDIFRRNGASHCQIGKSYPYRETRSQAAYGLLEMIKSAVDPTGLINPGALGLASG